MTNSWALLAATSTGSADFWTAVGLASAIATALATGISAFAAMWWRRQDRAMPDWAFLSVRASWNASEKAPDTRPYLSARLANAGDGTAFRMMVAGEHCDVDLRDDPPDRGPGMHLAHLRSTLGTLPVMPPGDSWALHVNCSGRWWNEAAVVITWTASPTWKRKQTSARYPLRELAERPTYRHSDWNAAAGPQTAHPPEPEDQRLPERSTAPPRRPWGDRLRAPWLRRTHRPTGSR